MKAILILLITGFSFLAQAQVSFSGMVDQMSHFDPEERPTVLLIGTFHYAEYQGDNSGNTFTAQVPNMMTEQKQKELDELVELLQDYQPTKVCVEYKSTGQSRLDSSYQKYLSIGSSESRNEIYQLAFRLASAAGHEKVYAVDENNFWYMDSVMNFAVANNQAEKLMLAGQLMPGFLADLYNEIGNIHIIDAYKEFNRKKELAFMHGFHQSFCAIGKGDNYIGTSLYHDWMLRNSKIFTNVFRVAEPNDRIVILYGASHIHSLKTMFEDSFDFDIIDYNEFANIHKK